jgi:DNA recombination protein RmuC
MPFSNYVIISIVIIGFGLILYFLNRKLKTILEKPKDDQSLLMLQNLLTDLRKEVDVKLSETHRAMEKQGNVSLKIVQDVTEKIAKLEETNKQVIGFTDQLQQLQDILKNPKQRGILGEYYLEAVLKNVLPPGGYEMQYKIGKDDDGKDLIVDAAVFVKDKIIPIDAKFSLENYNRIVEMRDPVEKERLEKQFKQDLKMRIDETSKYIKPNNGTMDFAFMFIPHEAIYYDLINEGGTVKINTRDLIEYAFKKHVFVVSPTSFLAYLQTVMQGLRALQIEETAKEIKKHVENLQKHLISYDTYFKKVGSNLGTTVNMYNQAYKELDKIDKDVVKITGGERQIEPLPLDKPIVE